MIQSSSCCMRMKYPESRLDPISVIIDRMKKGQEEILSAGAGAPGYPDVKPNAVEPANTQAAVQPNEASGAGATSSLVSGVREKMRSM